MFLILVSTVHTTGLFKFPDLKFVQLHLNLRIKKKTGRRDLYVTAGHQMIMSLAIAASALETPLTEFNAISLEIWSASCCALAGSWDPMTMERYFLVSWKKRWLPMLLVPGSTAIVWCFKSSAAISPKTGCQEKKKTKSKLKNQQGVPSSDFLILETQFPPWNTVIPNEMMTWHEENPFVVQGFVHKWRTETTVKTQNFYNSSSQNRFSFSVVRKVKKSGNWLMIPYIYFCNSFQFQPYMLHSHVHKHTTALVRPTPWKKHRWGLLLSSLPLLLLPVRLFFCCFPVDPCPAHPQLLLSPPHVEEG